MGYRLHFAKVHKVEWNGGYFSGSELPLVEDMLSSECPNMWQDENSDIWEVQKDELKAYLEKLKKQPSDEVNKYFKLEDKYIENYTNADMITILQDLLDNSEPDEDYIRIEWF